jgi:two-component system phosphate regulon sensor histidine kinase PhoR
VIAVLAAAVLLLAAALGAALHVLRATKQRLANEVEARGRAEGRIALLEEQRASDLRIFDGLGEAIVAVNRDREVVLANRRFRELFDVANPQGKRFHNVMRISAVFEAFDRALSGGEAVERFTTRSGIAERTIEMRALPLPTGDLAAVAVFIDVSRLERLEAIRRNFIADFSHEVRTPLAGLRSAVETYEGGVEQLTEAEELQLRRIMARQLRRLERLVTDLAELSRIESGDLHFSRERVDVRGLLDDLCEDFAERAAQQRIALRVSGDPVFALADPLRLQQALSNLIDNAMKYGGAGKPVEIEVLDGGTAAEIRVTDHGEGIPAADREKIFHRFYRVDKSRSQETGGTGLGLAITKHILLQHGGTIEVRSAAAEGSTFIVRVPKAESSVERIAEVREDRHRDQVEAHQRLHSCDGAHPADPFQLEVAPLQQADPCRGVEPLKLQVQHVAEAEVERGQHRPQLEADPRRRASGPALPPRDDRADQPNVHAVLRRIVAPAPGDDHADR